MKSGPFPSPAAVPWVRFSIRAFTAVWFKRNAREILLTPYSAVVSTAAHVAFHAGGELRGPPGDAEIRKRLLGQLRRQALVGPRRHPRYPPAADLDDNFIEKIWALETRLYRPDHRPAVTLAPGMSPVLCIPSVFLLKSLSTPCGR